MMADIQNSIHAVGTQQTAKSLGQSTFGVENYSAPQTVNERNYGVGVCRQDEL